MKKMLENLNAIKASLDALPTLDVNALLPDALVFSVDMNIGFTTSGALASPRSAAKLPATAEFLKACKDRGLRIIGISDTHPADCLEFASYPPHCVIGTEECAIAPELMPYIEKVCPKNSTNTMFSPEAAVLFEDARQVVITGCCTDICIHQFAVGLKAWANQRGQKMEVIVPVSLCDTFDAPGHNAELMNLVFFDSMAANGVTLKK